MYSSLSLTPTLLLLALLQSLPTATPACTSFIDTSPDFGGPNKELFSVDRIENLENLICPLDSKANCSLQPETYVFTLTRYLNVSVARGEEEDGIFELVRASYNEKAAAQGKPAVAAFVNMTGTVNSLDAPARLRTTVPGMNYTLVWRSRVYWGTGTLGGCSNKGLNGVNVQYSAPFEEQSNATNQTVLAGIFSSIAVNLSSPSKGGSPTSGGGKLDPGVGGGSLLGTLVVACAFAWFL